MPGPTVLSQILNPPKAKPKPWLLFDPRFNSVGALPNLNVERWGYDPYEVLNTIKGRGFHYVGQGGVTLTFNYANGPEDQQTAHRAVFIGGGANSGLVFIANVRLTPGTYTLAVDMKLTSGSPVTVNIGFGGSTALKTITNSYQTFSHTFTVAVTTSASLFIAQKNAASDAYDILFDNVRILVGSEVLVDSPPSCSLRFGSSRDATGNPTFTGNYTSSPVPQATVKCPYSRTLKEGTCLAAINLLANLSSGQSPLLNKYGGFNVFDFGLQVQSPGPATTPVTGPRFQMNGLTIAGANAAILNRGWVVIGSRFQNGLQEVLVNGYLAGRATNAVTPVTIEGFSTAWITTSNDNISATAAIWANVGPMKVFDKRLTDAEYVAEVKDIQQRLIQGGNTPADLNAFYMASGDSITIASFSYANDILSENTATLPGVIFAVSTVDLPVIMQNLEYQIPWIRNATQLGGNVIFSLLVGANMPVPTDTTAYYNLMVEVYRRVRGAGGKVVAMTILPNYRVGFNAQRAVINQMLRDNPQEYDALADLDTTAAGQDDAVVEGSTAPTTYFSDGGHPNAAGHDLYKVVVKAAIDSITATL